VFQQFILYTSLHMLGYKIPIKSDWSSRVLPSLALSISSKSVRRMRVWTVPNSIGFGAAHRDLKNWTLLRSCGGKLQLSANPDSFSLKNLQIFLTFQLLFGVIWSINSIFHLFTRVSMEWIDFFSLIPFYGSFCSERVPWRSEILVMLSTVLRIFLYVRAFLCNVMLWSAIGGLSWHVRRVSRSSKERNCLSKGRQTTARGVSYFDLWHPHTSLALMASSPLCSVLQPDTTSSKIPPLVIWMGKWYPNDRDLVILLVRLNTCNYSCFIVVWTSRAVLTAMGIGAHEIQLPAPSARVMALITPP